MESRFPFECIPTGWYAVAFSSELARGGVLPVHYFDRELVLYRTAAGAARLVDAHCPHLGAHLGYGGKVEGENLRCPFHGFTFNGTGACVSTPTGRLPSSSTRLRQWHVHETHDLILAWFDSRGRDPLWETPEADTDGWSRLLGKRYEIASHPQETTENSVDFGHFTELHDFEAARITDQISIDGPLLRGGYEVDLNLGRMGLRGLTLTTTFDVSAWGLGYSRVDSRVPALGITVRQWVLPAPLDEESIHLRLATRVRHQGSPLRRPFERLALALIQRRLVGEVELDREVWSRKRYLAAPGLTDAEVPLATYRQWARQFYPEF